eukprot:5566893-Pyramimonas_sp.AAC.1
MASVKNWWENSNSPCQVTSPTGQTSPLRELEVLSWERSDRTSGSDRTVSEGRVSPAPPA